MLKYVCMYVFQWISGGTHMLTCVYGHYTLVDNVHAINNYIAYQM